MDPKVLNITPQVFVTGSGSLKEDFPKPKKHLPSELVRMLILHTVHLIFNSLSLFSAADTITLYSYFRTSRLYISLFIPFLNLYF